MRGNTCRFSIGNGEHLGNTSVPLRGHLWFFHRKWGTPREHLSTTSGTPTVFPKETGNTLGTPRTQLGDTYGFSIGNGEHLGNTSGTPIVFPWKRGTPREHLATWCNASGGMDMGLKQPLTERPKASFQGRWPDPARPKFQPTIVNL